MRYFMILLAALLATGCSGKQDYGQAQAAVAMFHADYNSGNYARILDEAAPRLKSMPASKKMPRLLATTRARLGRYDGGTVGNWRVNYSASGTTVAIDYKSRYGGGAQAVERFLFAKVDDRIRLLGYQINSDAFLLQ